MSIEQIRMEPILFHSREDCCGCSACYAICRHDAIEMKEDEEGFLYPIIEIKKCVQCHQCERVCPIKVKKKDCLDKSGGSMRREGT